MKNARGRDPFASDEVRNGRILDRCYKWTESMAPLSFAELKILSQEIHNLTTWIQTTEEALDFLAKGTKLSGTHLELMTSFGTIKGPAIKWILQSGRTRLARVLSAHGFPDPDRAFFPDPRSKIDT